MKVILDCDPKEMGSALNLLFRVTSQNPTQKVGRGNAIKDSIGGKNAFVIRNQDSYTVKVG